jgi:hypothetical protein
MLMSTYFKESSEIAAIVIDSNLHKLLNIVIDGSQPLDEDGDALSAFEQIFNLQNFMDTLCTISTVCHDSLRR